MIDPVRSPLLTDLYQLTMLEGYLERGMNEMAVFELYVRSLPPARSFLLAAGLESLLTFLEGLTFGPEELAYLRCCGRFSPRLVEYLAGMRFTGDVHAMPEGTVFFADEPLIRITAPLCEAQLVETRLMNLLQQQVLFASKAARCVLAAAGRATLIDFGVRRAHGAEAGLFAARCSYLAGFIGTSTVLAETLYGIPIFGTMAHSFVEACDSEEQAFIAFAMANPGNVTLLIDTYDTLAGARKVVKVAPELTRRGIAIQAVRLDSGDVLTLSKQVRRILDEGGLPQVRIIVSGNIDEYAIDTLMKVGAPIDGFGVGTKMDTSADAPYLECAYKLMEYAGTARMKKSTGKVTWPGRKQVFRRLSGDGTMAGDVVCLADEPGSGEPLLVPVMARGTRLGPAPSLRQGAANAADQLRRLPPELRGLSAGRPYPVDISLAIQRLRDCIAASF